MTRKDTIDAIFAKRPLGAPNSTAVVERDRVRTGAISAMGASLQHLTETAKVAAQLQDKIDSGDLVTEVSPADIDGSFITDRIVLDVDPSIDVLIARHGGERPASANLAAAPSREPGKVSNRIWPSPRAGPPSDWASTSKPS